MVQAQKFQYPKIMIETVQSATAQAQQSFVVMGLNIRAIQSPRCLSWTVSGWEKFQEVELIFNYKKPIRYDYNFYIKSKSYAESCVSHIFLKRSLSFLRYTTEDKKAYDPNDDKRITSPLDDHWSHYSSSSVYITIPQSNDV